MSSTNGSMKPTWKVAEFLRSGPTDRVCQAIYPYIFNAGQEMEDMLPARKIAVDLIRQRFGYQYLTSYAAARSPQRLGGAYEILYWLDRLQVPLDEVDGATQTPLFYAAREANYQAVAFLLQRGAKAERLDHNSQTALFYAVKSDPKQEGTRIECDKRRTARGNGGPRKAIRKDLDIDGKSHKEMRLAVVDILVEYGADPTHQDELSRSAVDYARDEDMIRKLEALCQQWRERPHSRPTPTPRKLPLVEFPCMYLSRLDAAYDGQFMVAYSDAQDVEALVQLEGEFIDDHGRIIQQVHGLMAPATTVCKAVGVSITKGDRRKTIKSITGMRNQLGCTIKIMHIDPYAPRDKQAVCLELVNPPEVVGYMYQKIDIDANKPDTKKNVVEVSHLKIANTHVRRGLATMLFCGLVAHRGIHDGNEMRPLQLSVFDRNDPACRLYEKLGFVPHGERWESELHNWGSAQDKLVRNIGWRRYRRAIPGETPEKALAIFEAFLPYRGKRPMPSPSNDVPANKSRRVERSRSRDMGT